MVATKAVRRSTCGKAFLNFLYEQDADGPQTRAGVADFYDSPLSFWRDPEDRRVNAPRFSEADVDAVMEMLARRGLINGLDTAQSSFIYAWLTDDGTDCVEKYGGDYQRYLTERQRPAPVANTTTWNINGNTQIATGDNASQTMTIGTLEEAGLAVQRIVELASEQGLFAGREQELARRQAEAMAQFEADKPDPGVVEDFLQWVIDSVKQGGTAAIVAAVSVMSSDVLHQLAGLAS